MCCQSGTALSLVMFFLQEGVLSCNLIINRLHTLPHSPPLFFAFFRRRDDSILLCCPGCLGTQCSPDWLWTVDLSPHLHTGATVSLHHHVRPQWSLERPIWLVECLRGSVRWDVDWQWRGTSDPPDGEDAAVITEACCRHADATESDFDFFLFISKIDT